jgi:hypothetical protein
VSRGLAVVGVVGEVLALGLSEVFEFVLRHGVVHLAGGALEVGLVRLAAFGGEGGAGRLLLGFGLGRHGGAEVNERSE